MGSDLSVVNAARVSFAKHHDEFDDERDSKLIRYLARHGHCTPFGHTSVTIHVKAPIFVARQLAKHQVGLVWNEVSRRYVDSKPEFYVPDVWRGRPDGSIKQGSSTEDSVAVDGVDLQHMDLMVGYYNTMISDGICPEQARMVLPQSTYTEVVGNFTLAALARVYTQRADFDAQWEIQQYALAMGEVAREQFPVSWEALTGGE